MKQHKNLIPRAQEMYTMIEKYFASDLKQKTFCEQHGIAYSTFHWWLSKYKVAFITILSISCGCGNDC